ncbi:MAG: hypothetical protein KAX40_01045 [Herpetosiphon sp.]|nr:hypothetical protein [Herpetosiphon sp.]
MSQPPNPDQFRTRVLNDDQTAQAQQNWNQTQPPQWNGQPIQPQQQYWSNQPSMPAGQMHYQAPATNSELGFREEQNKLPKAIMIGVAVMLIGAVVWAGLAYLTGFIILYLAIGIGYGISYALLMPFRKPVSKAILVPLGISAVVLTLISVMLGSYLSSIFIVMRETAASFSDGVDITNELFFQSAVIPDHVKTGIFGLVGALISFFTIVKKS